MVRNESFSPSDICIWVRFDKYNTINWSCSGGGGGGESEGEKCEERRERVRSYKHDTTIKYINCVYI